MCFVLIVAAQRMLPLQNFWALGHLSSREESQFNIIPTRLVNEIVKQACEALISFPKTNS